MRAMSPVLLAFALTLTSARSADAQWFFAGYLGANKTQSADVSVEIPAANLSLVYHDVQFTAHPFESPQYYGWRIGKLFGKGRMFGIEGELIHLKVFAKTGTTYATSGSSGAVLLPSGAPMSAVVERYQMTHGLNFLLINVVARHELTEGASLLLRGGAGPTVAHTETTVLGGAIDQYERAGLGAHAAIGLNFRLRGRLSFVSDYQLTFARPEISVAGGKGRTSALSHHIAGGLAFGLSR